MSPVPEEETPLTQEEEVLSSTQEAKTPTTPYTNLMTKLNMLLDEAKVRARESQNKLKDNIKEINRMIEVCYFHKGLENPDERVKEIVVDQLQKEFKELKIDVEEKLQ
jgi:hypothetical protein